MDNKALTVSIVTCSFNQRAFLEATIQSVINQVNVDLEYIIIDGDSTDDSQSVIRQYQDKLSYWVSEPDSGQSEAINKGLKRARGDIVGWLCSDDLLAPGALEQVISFFENNPKVDAIYGDAVLINANGAILKKKREIGFHPWILANDHNYIPQPAMFWRRNVHSKIGYLREDLHLAMDLEFWLRMSKFGLKVIHINQCFAAMRCHDAQKVFTQRLALLAENTKIRNEYFSASRHKAQSFATQRVARASRIVKKLFHGGYALSSGKNLDDFFYGNSSSATRQEIK